MSEFNPVSQSKIVEEQVLPAANRGNILALTSTCNVRCLFCSHHQNPPGVETYRLNPLGAEQVSRALALMDPEKPVVIGESVTRVMEGEPFTHPAFREILMLIRRTLPRTTIQITTNGSLLTAEAAGFLAALGRVVIYLSLNSADPQRRRQLMQDRHAAVAAAAPALLQKYGIVCHGSVVAMPHVLGWADLADTLRRLDRYGASTIRVFLPGYTRLAPRELRFPSSLWIELHRFVDRLRSQVRTPLTVEPPLISDLQAVVTGVMAGTPAAEAGIKAGDVICAVECLPVAGRVDAFKRILAAAGPVVDLEREGKPVTVKLHKKAGDTSGLVMDYDIDLEDFSRRIRYAVATGREDRPALLLTSELGHPAVRLALARLFPGGAGGVRVLPVKNRFFGGSIKAAGLLVVEDMAAAVRTCLDNDRCARPALVVVPEIAFDFRGRDLTGRSYLDLREECGLAVRLA
ncbi:radical SAM protein [Desulfotomaculum copahuensis]|uniref:Radical SAM core domain-containing protein n=1 Tax=Desulfotomaculum copahuensis TaxID=1838280 RepID=A0A1B7LIG1_9FIRM|nr:radical SAM protein [Desulfotomaculum copahuensis]OAT86324.1 hypothetical protein A6M21_16850 [Desulfotomaculum copahuensis]